MNWVWGLKPVIKHLAPALAPRITRLRQYEPRPMRTYGRKVAPDASCIPITIVTPSFRQERFIERTIESVLNQDYPKLEYVVVDGGSDEGTLNVLRRHSTRLARWTSEPDEGQADALNKGFAGTSGEVMAYLNSDDVLLPGALATVDAIFRAQCEIDVIYGHRVIIDEDDREIGRWILPAHDGEILRWMDWVPQETLFWRRRAWIATGGRFDESLRFALDWDFLLRLANAGMRFRRVNRFMGAFRLHTQQKTSTLMATAGAEEIARLRKRSLGRDASLAEIRAAVAPYLVRHLVMDLSWRCGIGSLLP